jgi:hypothetical protein
MPRKLTVQLSTATCPSPFVFFGQPRTSFPLMWSRTSAFCKQRREAGRHPCTSHHHSPTCLLIHYRWVANIILSRSSHLSVLLLLNSSFSDAHPTGCIVGFAFPLFSHTLLYMLMLMFHFFEAFVCTTLVESLSSITNPTVRGQFFSDMNFDMGFFAIGGNLWYHFLFSDMLVLMLRIFHSASGVSW